MKPRTHFRHTIDHSDALGEIIETIAGVDDYGRKRLQASKLHLQLSGQPDITDTAQAQMNAQENPPASATKSKPSRPKQRHSASRSRVPTHISSHKQTGEIFGFLADFSRIFFWFFQIGSGANPVAPRNRGRDGIGVSASARYGDENPRIPVPATAIRENGTWLGRCRIFRDGVPCRSMIGTRKNMTKRTSFNSLDINEDVRC